jgi:hypothetical protein
MKLTAIGVLLEIAQTSSGDDITVLALSKECLLGDLQNGVLCILVDNKDECERAFTTTLPHCSPYRCAQPRIPRCISSSEDANREYDQGGVAVMLRCRLSCDMGHIHVFRKYMQPVARCKSA